MQNIFFGVQNFSQLLLLRKFWYMNPTSRDSNSFGLGWGTRNHFSKSFQGESNAQRRKSCWFNIRNRCLRTWAYSKKIPRPTVSLMITGMQRKCHLSQADIGKALKSCPLQEGLCWIHWWASSGIRKVSDNYKRNNWTQMGLLSVKYTPTGSNLLTLLIHHLTFETVL